MKFEIQTICCIGAGYVGGPTMAVIADKCPHLQVNVVDINHQRIDLWNNSNLDLLPIFEPGLSEIIKKCRGKNLHFSTELEKNIRSADMIFISVNTPTKTKGIGRGKALDLKWIESSARKISKYARTNTIVVEKSTLPVKTADTIKKILDSVNYEASQSDVKNKKFTVLSNPEFLAEGTAIRNLQDPDRVLIGGEDEEAIMALKKIYLNWIIEKRILTTNLWSSELSKLTANAFLAQRISSINSISALCEETGADIKEVSLAVGMDSRIGSEFLEAGPGFGGSCFKKDILNLIYLCDYYGLENVSKYWQQVIELNDWQRERISKIIVNRLFSTISGKRIAILGFAFKANTNDTRESAAIDICKNLLEEGGNLRIYDPKVSAQQIEKDLNCPQNLKGKNSDSGNWIFTKSIEEASDDADGIIILTEWEEFKYINWEKISGLMRKPSWLFDTRLVSDINEATSFGIHIWALGNG